MNITSTAFEHNGEIPRRYTCMGDDISPPLYWTGVPPGTRSLALIMDDPDAPDPAAPKVTWVHWLLYNLPPDMAGLPEDYHVADLPAGAGAGMNDWQRAGYGGPCPPVGRHRYYHKLYALDTALDNLRSPKKHELETAMKGHILASAELVGTFSK